MRSRSLFCAVAAAAALMACKKEVAPPPPPPEVKVATVIQRDVPIYIEAIGETRGSTEIEIRARVEGFLRTVEFEEGSLVRKGQLLYTIDPRPFEAALAQSRGDLARSQAELARARQDVSRYEPLVKKNAVSREQYDTALAQQQAAEAAVEASKATVDNAQLNLSYCRVEAPQAGLVGKTEVYPGTLVSLVSNSLLTRISQVDQIHVRVNIAEKDYLYYTRRHISRGGTTQDKPKAESPLQLLLADGSVYPHGGRLVFTDRSVDPRTGTILVEAAFPNPEMLLRPGQYARMRATMDLKKGAILVSQRAVQELQGIRNVAVVGADETVEFRPVVPAERVGSLWVIDSGLKAGDTIIVEGLQKVRPGSKVRPQVVLMEEPPAPAPGDRPAGQS